ncbi:MAG: hypothetical protein ACXWW4_02130 [Candidatus Binatia bacterium]
MTQSNRAVLAFALGLALVTSVGCSDHNVSLVGRDTLPARASKTVRSDIARTVERVDTGTSVLHLRASQGRPAMVTYSAETRVMYLGRDYPVSQLQSGDVVAMQMQMDARGNPHTHAIDLQKSSRDWAQSRN